MKSDAVFHDMPILFVFFELIGADIVKRPQELPPVPTSTARNKHNTALLTLSRRVNSWPFVILHNPTEQLGAKKAGRVGEGYQGHHVMADGNVLGSFLPMNEWSCGYVSGETKRRSKQMTARLHPTNQCPALQQGPLGLSPRGSVRP